MLHCSTTKPFQVNALNLVGKIGQRNRCLAPTLRLGLLMLPFAPLT
jgi:hypothetical protein